MCSTRREVAVPFVCQRSGDCCREPNEVRMTHQERAEIERVAPTSTVLSWRSDPDPRFVRLIAKPCPLLAQDEAGRAVCTVHEVRPLLCRTFMCGRPDPKKEPWEPEPVNWVLGLTGCGNLSARLTESLRFREHYRTNAVQEKKRWGRPHGWT